MFQITAELYEQLAAELRASINSSTIFSGKIELCSDEVETTFIATIIPYYHREHFPEGSVENLYDIVPVWWELHTTIPEGEVINDFDFDTLKFLLCQQ